MSSKARGLADLGNAFDDGALSNRNLIINGGMAVDQRNGGSSIVFSGSATYAVDRMSSFKGVSSGVITGQQSTLGNAKSYKITATTGVSSFSGTQRVHALIHIIEGQNAFFANGQTVTLSFKVETNWSGNLAVRLGNGDWTRTYIVNAVVTSGVNDVAVSVPLEANTVAANNNTAGLVVEIGTTGEGSLQTSTEGSWIAGGARNLTTSTQWTKTTGNFINVTELQLDVGDTATPFEHPRSFGEELARCQRYFERWDFPVSFDWYVTNSAASAHDVECPYNGAFAVAKRATPTYSRGGTFIVSNLSSNDWTARPATNSITFYNGASAAGRYYSYNSTSAYLDFDAEL